MTTPTIAVSSVTLPYIEYHGTPVVTFAMIDAAHQRPAGTARKRFNDNKRHLIENEDFYVPDSERLSEIRTTYPDIFPERTTRLSLFTETGYLMIVKSFTDDLAWQVQRQLVKSYFRVKGAMQPTTAPPVPEPITHIQRDEMHQTANMVFFSFGGYRQSATGWLYNRLRTKYNLKRIEDLSQDDYPEAMDIIAAQKAKVVQYQALNQQLRETFIRDVIGHGECWTAWVSKHAGGAHKIGSKPNWKQLAQDILKHYRITASRD